MMEIVYCKKTEKIEKYQDVARVLKMKMEPEY